MRDITYIATITSTAIKSECGRFRYQLKRVWDPHVEIGAFLCANPSKADHLLDDNTVFKCSNLSVQWKWGGFYILNLYPGYSTDPKMLERSAETDARNAHHIATVASQVEKIVLACGNGHKRRLKELIDGVPKGKLFCLRRNSGGGFLHPSRINPEDFPKPVRAYDDNA
jgi:hypothetical protein